MSDNIATFRRQHQGLFGMGAEIVVAMQRPPEAEAVREVRRLVARFKGALLVHERMESEALYPRLIAHPDPLIAGAAAMLFEELDGLYDAFGQFEQRWARAEAAEQNPQEYYANIKRLLKKLMARMQREDIELYALVERADQNTTSACAPAVNQSNPEAPLLANSKL